MFSSLFFVILTVVLINLGPEIRNKAWVFNSETAALLGLALYFATLCILYVQNIFLTKQRYRSRWLIVANIELIISLGVMILLLGSDRIFGQWQSLGALATLFMYFGGIAFFHYTFNKDPHRIRKFETLRQLKLIVPFTLPFILILALLDTLGWVPQAWNDLAVTGISLLGIGGMMVFLPSVICRTWGCIPLREEIVKARLERLCKEANFKHAGLLEWTVMNHSPTAAIIGVLPRFRYILFSRHLLHVLPPQAIDAILAHEIGHSQRRHLIIYPLVIMGMMFTAFLAGFLFDAVTLDWHNSYLKPLALFLVYALVLGIYFRLVFGFFSRLFERQADLHVLNLGLPLQDMITALDEVGLSTGNSHFIPSWHHYSIAQRMEFLQRCIENPALVARHHKFVKVCIIIFMILLVFAIAGMVYYT